MAEPVLFVIDMTDKASPQIRQLTNTAITSLKSVETAGDQAIGKVGKVGSTLVENFERAAKVSLVFGGVTGALGLVSAAVSFAAKNILDFDLALREVATISPEVRDNFARVKDAIIAMDPALGSTTQLTKALYEAYSAGIIGSHNFAEGLNFVRVAAELAKGSLTTSEVAVKILASTINAYGLELKEAGKISDIFFKAVELGQFRFAELAEHIGPVLPLAKTLNISISDVAASLATLSQAGINVSTGATGLKTFFTDLVKNAAEFKRVGIDVAAVIGEGGLPLLFRKMAEATGMNSQAMAKLIPDVRGLNVVLSLLNQDQAKVAQNFKDTAEASEVAHQAFLEIKKAWAEGLKEIGNEFERIAQKNSTLIQSIAQAVVLGPVKAFLESVNRETGQINIAGKEAASVFTNLVNPAIGVAKGLAEQLGGAILSGIGSAQAKSGIASVGAAAKLAGDEMWIAGQQAKEAALGITSTQLDDFMGGVAQETAKVVTELKAVVVNSNVANLEFLKLSSSIEVVLKKSLVGAHEAVAAFARELPTLIGNMDTGKIREIMDALTKSFRDLGVQAPESLKTVQKEVDKLPISLAEVRKAVTGLNFEDVKKHGEEVFRLLTGKIGETTAAVGTFSGTVTQSGEIISNVNKGAALSFSIVGKSAQESALAVRGSFDAQIAMVDKAIEGFTKLGVEVPQKLKALKRSLEELREEAERWNKVRLEDPAKLFGWKTAVQAMKDAEAAFRDIRTAMALGNTSFTQMAEHAKKAMDEIIASGGTVPPAYTQFYDTLKDKAEETAKNNADAFKRSNADVVADTQKTAKDMQTAYDNVQPGKAPSGGGGTGGGGTGGGTPSSGAPSLSPGQNYEDMSDADLKKLANYRASKYGGPSEASRRAEIELSQRAMKNKAPRAPIVSTWGTTSDALVKQYEENQLTNAWYGTQAKMEATAMIIQKLKPVVISEIKDAKELSVAFGSIQISPSLAKGMGLVGLSIKEVTKDIQNAIDASKKLETSLAVIAKPIPNVPANVAVPVSKPTPTIAPKKPIIRAATGVDFARSGQVVRLDAGERVVNQRQARPETTGYNTFVPTSGPRGFDYGSYGMIAPWITEGVSQGINQFATGRVEESFGENAQRELQRTIIPLVKGSIHRRDLTRPISRATRLTRKGVPNVT